MATLESLQAILEARRQMPVQPEAPAVDLAEVVAALDGISVQLREAAQRDENPEGLRHAREMVTAANAIAKAIAPLSEAISALAIPAPVVNVAAPNVTVERSDGPVVATIFRDEQGYMKRVVFDRAYDDDTDDDGVEIE